MPMPFAHWAVARRLNALAFDRIITECHAVFAAEPDGTLLLPPTAGTDDGIAHDLTTHYFPSHAIAALAVITASRTLRMAAV